MNIYEITFSPTGGVRKVADILTSALGASAQQIDLCDTGFDFAACSLQADDLAVFAVPAYGGRIPAVAAERMARMCGNGARAVLVAVYGNRAIDDTLMEMQDVCTAAGFNCIAGVSAVAEHSLVREYGAGRPDAQDAEELKSFAAKIIARLESGETGLNVPGNRPYRTFGGGPVKPAANENCTKCGLCVRSCPTGALCADDPALPDPAKCTACMRCVEICPQKARIADAAVLSAIAEKLRPICTRRGENALYID